MFPLEKSRQIVYLSAYDNEFEIQDNGKLICAIARLLNSSMPQPAYRLSTGYLSQKESINLHKNEVTL